MHSCEFVLWNWENSIIPAHRDASLYNTFIKCFLALESVMHSGIVSIKLLSHICYVHVHVCRSQCQSTFRDVGSGCIDNLSKVAFLARTSMQVRCDSWALSPPRQGGLANWLVVFLLRLCSTDGLEGLGFSSCAAPLTRVCAPNLRRADIDGRRCMSRPDERSPKSGSI
jgi:hypothetical protein